MHPYHLQLPAAGAGPNACIPFSVSCTAVSCTASLLSSVTLWLDAEPRSYRGFQLHILDGNGNVECVIRCSGSAVNVA